MKNVFIQMLLSLGLVCLLDAQSCTPFNTGVNHQPPHALYRPGKDTPAEVNIAGIFSIHRRGTTPYTCGEIQDNGLQHMEAFLWAVRTFKTRYPGLLGEVSIGAIGLDSCADVSRITQQVLNVENCDVAYGIPPVKPASVLAYIGTDSSAEAVAATRLLQGMNKTLVSHAATGAFLGNVTQYPYFLRTVSSDAAQAQTIADVLNKLGWMYIQVVRSDSDYGTAAFEAFSKIAKSFNICIVQNQTIRSGMQTQKYDVVIRKLSLKQTTRVVLVLADKSEIGELLLATLRANARGRFTWVGTSTWDTKDEFASGVKQVAEGALVISLDDNRSMPNFVRFGDYFSALSPLQSDDNPWLKKYWEERFECHLPGGTSRFSATCNTNLLKLSASELDSFVPHVIEAVDSVLHGIEEVRRNSCPNTEKLCARFKNKNTKLIELYEAIKNPSSRETAITTDSENMRQMIMNYRPAQNNCPNHCYVQVGTYESPRIEVALSVDEVHMYDKSGNRIDQPIPSVCASTPCVECGGVMSSMEPTSTTDLATQTEKQTEPEAPSEIREGTWVIVLIILTCLGILFIVILEIYLITKMVGSPFVNHWRTMWLGQLLLFSLLLCYLVLFAFVPSPTLATCAIKRLGVGVSYSMCFAVLLVKLMIILSSKSIGYLKGVYQFLMFVFAWGVQIVVDVEWLILRKPGVHLNASSSGEEWLCNEDFPSHIQSLVYVMFLIIICTVLAIKAHDIITNHRECLFIGMAAGLVIPVWIAWLLLGMLHDNKDYQEPAMAFGLFSTTTVVLFIMFLPKVRQLNSMGMEGIYAEDDAVEYAGSGVISVGPASRAPGSIGPASIAYGPPSYKSKNGHPASLAHHNGSVYAEPMVYSLPRNVQNPEALYLRHQATTAGTSAAGHSAASVRSMPVGYIARPDTYATTGRIARRTNELSGKPAMEKKTQSEYNYDVCYGTASRRGSGSLRGGRQPLSLTKAKSLQDLGSL